MPALPSPGEQRRRGAGGAEQGEKGWREMGTVSIREEGKKEGGLGMGRRVVPPGSRRLEGEQCDLSRPVRGLIPAPRKARGWIRRGSLVVDQRGTDGKRHDRTFFFFFCLFLLGSGTCCPYQVSLAHNILPKEKESSRGRGWCRKLMEDVTNHRSMI